jgi:hypothetical protein
VLVTNHVLSGALIGALVRRPVPAFAIGVASHFALDAVPHWGDWGSPQQFLRVAVPDGLAGLAAIGALAAAARPERRLAVLAGMAGAALPDIDKPARLWFGRSPWPEPVNKFHSAIQNEASHRSRSEMATMGVLAVAGLLAVRAKPSHVTRQDAHITRQRWTIAAFRARPGPGA